jgi:hypothetical protein
MPSMLGFLQSQNNVKANSIKHNQSDQDRGAFSVIDFGVAKFSEDIITREGAGVSGEGGRVVTEAGGGGCVALRGKGLTVD